MEQEQQSDIQNLTKDVRKKRTTSRFIWPVIILVVLALGLGFWFYKDNFSRDPDLSLSPSEVNELPQDQQRLVLEKQLQDLQEQEKALTADSDSGDRFTTYIQLGEVYTELGRHQEALDALENIRQERQGNTRLWMTYAQVYRNMGDIPQAIGMTRQALNIDPGIPDNWLFLFELSEDLPREQQEAVYTEALQKTENDPEITAAYQSWQQNNPQ